MRRILTGIAAIGVLGGLSMVPLSSQAEPQARALEVLAKPAKPAKPAPERLTQLSISGETAKQRFDRLRGTTPRRGGRDGQHRSSGDRAHKRMKQRRAASHHGA